MHLATDLYTNKNSFQQRKKKHVLKGEDYSINRSVAKIYVMFVFYWRFKKKCGKKKRSTQPIWTSSSCVVRMDFCCKTKSGNWRTVSQQTGRSRFIWRKQFLIRKGSDQTNFGREWTKQAEKQGGTVFSVSARTDRIWTTRCIYYKGGQQDFPNPKN